MDWTVIPKNQRYEITNMGDVRNKKTGRVLTGGINNRGYRTVHIDHYDKPEFVHRLVAEVFVPNDDPVHKTDVNHRDGNKLNNDYTNLEWVTRSDNVKHAYKNGLNRPSGGGQGKIRVRVNETGKIYNSQQECVDDIGGSIAGLSMYLTQRRKQETYRGYHIHRI